MVKRAPAKLSKRLPQLESSEVELLRVNSLLIGLDDKAFKAFAKRCEFVPVCKGDVLIEEGSSQDNAFFVVKGKVRIIQGDSSAVNIVYREIDEGGWFGEIAAIDKGQRTAAAYALTDGLVAVAPRAAFLNLVLEHRQIAVKVLESFATLIRSSNQRFAEASSFSGVQRVYLQLLELAKPDPSGDGSWVIYNMPSHEQLSVKALTSKETVTQALSQILQEKIAKRITGKLRILNREALKRLATKI